MTTELKVGDKIKRRYGPFEATAEVTEVTEAGAVLKVHDDAKFVGFEYPTESPRGFLLADKDHDFIGRAHWPDTVEWGKLRGTEIH